MKITIIGTGYVGLVSGACFAELGINVTCIDKDLSKIKNLKAGRIPIFEPGLEKLVKKNSKNGRLRFLSQIDKSINKADAIFIAVGTPTEDENGGADLSYVYAVASELAEFIEDGAVIVTKSTVPVGTGDKIKDIIRKAKPELSFDVVSNPEFLREGCAVKDFLEPDRIIIGAESDKAEKVMKRLYASLSNKSVPVLYTDIRTAELTKYASNAFLATKIGFINEMADICEKVGANIEDVSRGMGYDFRIGMNYLSPGPGFGGSCFPKDTLALRKISIDAGVPSKIVESVILSNERRKISMADKIKDICGGSVKNKTITILGVAFKANTDDIRYSPSLLIIPELIRDGAKIRAFDPEAMEHARMVLGEESITWCSDSYDAMKDADAAVIITEWDEFKKLDLKKVKKTLRKPLIVDLRNLFSTEKMKEMGFIYSSVGR